VSRQSLAYGCLLFHEQLLMVQRTSLADEQSRDYGVVTMPQSFDCAARSFKVITRVFLESDRDSLLLSI
jgi:hypothetical protein